MDNLEWLDAAACADAPLAWFFPTGTGDDWQQGVAVCGTCPVRAECAGMLTRFPKLLMGQQTGTWAGTTGSQRRRARLGYDRSARSLRKARRRAERAAAHQVAAPGSVQS